MKYKPISFFFFFSFSLKVLWSLFWTLEAALRPHELVFRRTSFSMFLLVDYHGQVRALAGAMWRGPLGSLFGHQSTALGFHLLTCPQKLEHYRDSVQLTYQITKGLLTVNFTFKHLTAKFYLILDMAETWPNEDIIRTPSNILHLLHLHQHFLPQWRKSRFLRG